MLSISAQVGKNLVDPVFVNDSQALLGYTQTNVAFLRFDPETFVLQIWQKPSACFVICMGNIVTALWALPGHLTDFRHERLSL